VSAHEPGQGPPTTALVVDVDGVVSPTGRAGPLAWGDAVVAGHVFGPVLVSPGLCRALDELAARPGVTPLWLTSWTAAMRKAMDPFPGRTWPELVSDPDDPDLDWWKWAALCRWLDSNPEIARVAWCDDQLTDANLVGLRSPYRPAPPAADSVDAPNGTAVIHTELARRHIDARLFAPPTTRGLTPADVKLIAAFLTPPRGAEPVSARP
jgi:hypothetical protein